MLQIWQQDRKTVLFVTHSIDEAVFLSDVVLIMGTRPGRHPRAVDVDLPRPRAKTVRTDPRFSALTARIWEHIRGQLDGAETTA